MFERKALYSPQEVAQIAGLSTSTILNYIRSDKLYAIKLSERTYRIPIASLIATFFPELKRAPKIVRRTGDVDATWERWTKEAHAAYERPTTGRLRKPARTSAASAVRRKSRTRGAAARA